MATKTKKSAAPVVAPMYNANIVAPAGAIKRESDGAIVVAPKKTAPDAPVTLSGRAEGEAFAIKQHDVPPEQWARPTSGARLYDDSVTEQNGAPLTLTAIHARAVELGAERGIPTRAASTVSNHALARVTQGRWVKMGASGFAIAPQFVKKTETTKAAPAKKGAKKK